MTGSRRGSMVLSGSLPVFLSVLLKSYSTSKFSLFMLLCSLVIATSGLSAVLIINDSAKQSYANDSYSDGNQSPSFIPAPAFQIIPNSPDDILTKADYATLRKNGFSELIAVAQNTGYIYQANEQITDQAVEFIGIDMLSLLPFLKRNSDASSDRSAELLPAFMDASFNQTTGFINPVLLNDLETKNPDILNLDLSLQPDNANDQTNYSVLPELYPVDANALALNNSSNTGNNSILLDIGELYRLFPDQTLGRLFWVMPKDHPDFETEKQRLIELLPTHLVLAEIIQDQQNTELTESFHLNLLAMALLMFVVCLFIVLNAVNLLLASRKPWLAICRQLGISRQTVFSAQLLEIIFLTFLSTLIGIVFGLYLAKLVSPSIQATLEGLYRVKANLGQVSLLSLFVQVFGVSLAGSLAAVLIPLQKAKKALLANPNENTGKVEAVFQYKLFCLLGMSFALACIAILLTSQPLWMLLLSTACLMLSGCCFLLASYPKMLSVTSKLIPHSMPLLQTSSKQSLALSGKTKIACCAFFIAATSNIGMNLMVDSFRNATVSWLDTRLTADYYLYYKGDIAVEPLANLSGIKLFPRYENRIPFKGIDIQQYSYPITEKFKQAMVFYQVDDAKANLNNVWQSFEANQAVFVNQQFAFHFGYGLNDSVTLPHPGTGEETPYQISGIIYDFGSPDKQVLFPIDQFNPDRSDTSIYAIEAAPTQLEKFKQLLTENNIATEERLIATEALLALSMETFDRTFVITDGLNIVTLLVAALSLACAIILLMDGLRPQNMLIRSMGISSVKTQALALFQYLLLCLLALVFATPFGILLSWVLIHEINYQAFQWTYPLQINPVNILQIYLLSLFVVLVVIAIPIIRAGRKPLIEDIRWLN